MKSFALLQTNTGLTTNIKFMVSSEYKLFMDSIDSDASLSYDRYKKVVFNKDNFFDELIPYFFKNTPTDVAFSIKYENDNDSMSSDFKDQYDEIYQYGARNISNNKSYKEEYEYFAPLYIEYGAKLPSNFLIFRVDGSGIERLTKDNFKSNILRKLKFVKGFDLSKSTSLGQWLDRSFVSNPFRPTTTLDMNFDKLEFCSWNGIDYQNGGYTSKSLFLDDYLDEEKELFELERFVFDNYKLNGVVFPNILNLSFLFDDTPSTPELVRKWSLNRYYGFYVNELQLMKSVSPYRPIPLLSDITVNSENVIISPSNTHPFVQEWTDTKPFYVEYNGNYYLVERLEVVSKAKAKVQNQISSKKNVNMGFSGSKGNQSNEVTVSNITSNTNSSIEDITDVITYKYKIIADISLQGLGFADFNKNFAQIELATNRLVDANNESLDIGIDDQDGNIGIWLIEVDGIMHNIIFDGELRLNTDYNFKFNENDYIYRVAGKEKKVSTFVDFENEPKKFNIYRLNLTDIKAFDTRIIDTDYSRYEYEKSDELSTTDETKMYLENIAGHEDILNLDDFIFQDEVVNIPVSSEYTANYETFKVDNTLSSIWRKNPVYSRFAFDGSVSGNDMPYVLNNNLIFEDYNRTTNVYESLPNRVERNLDYFYTLHMNTSEYEHQSLHIESEIFELDKYLNFNYDYDYFTAFFKRKQKYSNGYRNVTKYSLFNLGDESVSARTLFRGIQFNIVEITDISLLDTKNFQRINYKSTSEFNGYKFSVLVSDHSYKLLNERGFIIDNKVTDVKQIDSSLQWTVIENWDATQQYELNALVLHDDMLYRKNDNLRYNYTPMVTVRDTRIPITPLNMGFVNEPNPAFWDGNSSREYIMYDGEYYINSNDKASSGGIFIPMVEYAKDDIVMYKGKYYKSLISGNLNTPRHSSWVEIPTPSNRRWRLVEGFNEERNYETGDYSVKSGLLQKLISKREVRLGRQANMRSELDAVESVNNTEWEVVNSFEPIGVLRDGQIYYFNDSYHRLEVNTDKNQIDNGINIYINKKWKNILVDINVSDNTYTNLSDTNRDELYKEIYTKLTASNFSNALNDISNKFKFGKYVRYIVIDNDIRVYSFEYENIQKLPYMLSTTEPSKLEIKVNSLFKRAVEKPISLNAKSSLNGGKILNLSQLNYYNSIPVASNIIPNVFQSMIYDNYHGSNGVQTNTIYRYNGNYVPLMIDVNLFEYDSFGKPSGNFKFDTSLLDFGIMKERKIRKVNRRRSVLKLANTDDVSIYPMLDEFGYSTYDFFIFNSTWDEKYYLEVGLSKNDIDMNRVNVISIPNDIGQNLL